MSVRLFQRSRGSDTMNKVRCRAGLVFAKTIFANGFWTVFTLSRDDRGFWGGLPGDSSSPSFGGAQSNSRQKLPNQAARRIHRIWL